MRAGCVAPVWLAVALISFGGQYVSITHTITIFHNNHYDHKMTQKAYKCAHK
jgi:chromate transport protein ChrA